MIVFPDPPRRRVRTFARRLAGALFLALVAAGALVATGAHESAWVHEHTPWLEEPAARFGDRLDDLAEDARALLPLGARVPGEPPPPGGTETGDGTFAAPDSLGGNAGGG